MNEGIVLLLVVVLEFLINVFALWFIPKHTERKIPAQVISSLRQKEALRILTAITKRSAEMVMEDAKGKITNEITGYMKGLEPGVVEAVEKALDEGDLTLKIGRILTGHSGISTREKKKLDKAFAMDILKNHPAGMLLSFLPDVKAQIDRNPQQVYYYLERFAPQILKDAHAAMGARAVQALAPRETINTPRGISSDQWQKQLTAPSARGPTEAKRLSTNARPKIRSSSGQRMEGRPPTESGNAEGVSTPTVGGNNQWETEPSLTSEPGAL